MSILMTSDDLITSVKRRAFLPTQQNTFTNADFLSLADEEMAMGLVPTILRMHEDYLLYSEEINLVQNQFRYTIPYRAIGNKLREVSFKDPQGNIYEMTRVGIGDMPYFNYGNVNRPYAYYVDNNEIVLVPAKSTLSTNYKIVMTYYMRPNSLVMLEEVASIASIDRDTGVITLNNLPRAFTTNEVYDFVTLKTPNKTLDFDISISAIDAILKTITFAPADIPTGLSVGDHICLAEQSAIPQVPADLHVLLAHRVATRCLEALGDTEGLQNANLKLAELNEQANALIDNRVDDAPQKAINRHSTLRSGVYNRRTRIRGY